MRGRLGKNAAMLASFELPLASAQSPDWMPVMNKSFLAIALDWVPILIFLGVLIYFLRKAGSLNQKAHLEAVKTYMTEHVAEQKRTNEMLARIATALERRSEG